MSRQLWLADVAADTFRGVKGYQVDVMPGWKERGSDYFDPDGVCNHHTGAGSYAALLNYMTYGSSIKPLCNAATSRPQDGIVRITIVAAGRANHAGKGYLPWTGRDNGNYHMIGLEHQNSGGEKWPDQQVEGIRMLDAALLIKLGQDVDRMVDHKTYAPDRKVDRFATDVATERRAVRELMQQMLNPDPWEEFWMSLSKAEKAKLEKLAKLGNGQIEALLEARPDDYSFLRDMRVAANKMNSSAAGFVRYMIAYMREGRARGIFTVDPTKVAQNRAYTLKQIEAKREG